MQNDTSLPMPYNETSTGTAADAPATSAIFVYGILFLFGSIVVGLILLFRNARDVPDGQTSVRTTQQQTEIDSTYLSPEYRQKAYNRAFELNGNHVQLTPENFSTGRGKQDSEHGSGDKISNEPSSRFLHQSTESIHLNIKRRGDTEDLTNFTTHGTCAICLEQYEPGQFVVFSEDEECSHVYHRHCIVGYFSTKKKVREDNNPCPTCRRNFVTILPMKVDPTGHYDEEAV